MSSPQQPAAYNSGIGYPVSQVIDGNLTLVDVYGTGQYGILTAAQINAISMGLSSLALSESAAGGRILTVTNTHSAPSDASVKLIAAAATDLVFGAEVSGDTSLRFGMETGGQLRWGPGNKSPDTFLYRSGAGQLAGPGVGGFSINALSSPFNADPTGTTDSGPGINAAMAAAAALGANGGGSVYLAPGTYLIETSLVPQSGVRLFSDNKESCTLSASGINLFNMNTASTLWYFELDHVYLKCSGGHIFSGSNLGRCYFHDNFFQQNSTGYSIWDNTAGAGLMQDSVFERNLHSLNGGTPRTTPAWNLYAPTNSNQINNVTWRDEKLFNNNADTAEYCFAISAANGVANDTNVFENLIFENFLGGCISAGNCRSTRVINCGGWDPTGDWMASLFYFYSNGGFTPVNNVIQASGRILGTLGSSTVSDIQLDSNCEQTTIICPRGSNSLAPTIDLGGGTDTTILGSPGSGMVLRNSTGGYAYYGTGGAYVSGGNGLQVNTAGDGHPRVYAAAAGTLNFGSGSAATDTSLQRASGQLELTNPAGLVGNVSTAPLTGVTLATVTAASPTNICAYTIPSGDPVAGAVYQLTAWGHGTWGSTAQALNFQAVYHSGMGQIIISSTALATSAAFVWRAEAVLQFLTVGSSGTYMGCVRGSINQTANSLVPGTAADNTIPFVGALTTSTTGATNGSYVWSIQAGWASTTGAPTITADGGFFQRIA